MIFGDRLRLGAIVLAVIAASIIGIYWHLHPLPPVSELTDGITNKDGYATSVFDEDVRRKFPVGTPVSIFRRELIRQGFVEVSQNGSERLRLSFIRHEWSRVCEWNFTVDGTATAQSRIASVHGRYVDGKCLI